MKYLLLLIVLLGCAQSVQQLRYVKDTSALCLDGTKATYYYEKGDNEKYLIFFEGGGWIQGDTEEEMLQQAYDRSKTSLGSSKFQQSSVQMDGIFNRDEKLNPEFYNWNIIYINYCDGTGHQGYREEPISIKDQLIYIRGDRIFKSILFEFEYSLFRAEQVLLSGCSAGGLAVFTWAQYLKDTLPFSVEILAAPDSGVFLDLKPINDSLPASDRRQKQYHKLANAEIDPPNSACVKAYPNDKWKCQFAQYLIDFIDVPIFFVQSWYDAACIPNILRIYSAGDLTLSKCTAKELEFIENQHQAIKQVIDTRKQKDDKTGAFAPSCLEHCFLHKNLFYSTNWEIPQKSGVTMSLALSSWVLNLRGDINRQDSQNWPSNQGCSNIDNLFIK